MAFCMSAAEAGPRTPGPPAVVCTARLPVPLRHASAATVAAKLTANSTFSKSSACGRLGCHRSSRIMRSGSRCRSNWRTTTLSCRAVLRQWTWRCESPDCHGRTPKKSPDSGAQAPFAARRALERLTVPAEPLPRQPAEPRKDDDRMGRAGKYRAAEQPEGEPRGDCRGREAVSPSLRHPAAVGAAAALPRGDVGEIDARPGDAVFARGRLPLDPLVDDHRPTAEPSPPIDQFNVNQQQVAGADAPRHAAMESPGRGASPPPAAN